MQINACILRPNASAKSIKSVFQTKKLPASINQINTKFALKAAVTPSVARKPHHLQEIKMWKATELQQFLLYTGPVVLYKKVISPVYQNFLLLSASMKVFLDSDMRDLSYNFVEQVLEAFVANFSNIYGRKTISYKVHGFLHIVDDAQKFGPLSNISRFSFVNYLEN